MRLNSADIIELSLKKGDQEGRLTHKPPSKSLYDTACKERWFKLKGNLLFYYRLNEEGAVEKNEPHGVFVLENIAVEQLTEELKHGFTITWKDDPYRKHSFYAPSKELIQNWITKLLRASYENLRAELLVLRVQIRQKTGKDPLEYYGPPLPVVSIRGMLVSPSKATQLDPSLRLSTYSSETGLAAHRDSGKEMKLDPSFTVNSAPSTPSIPPKFVPEEDPVPPPRANRDRRREGSKKGAAKSIGPNDVTFKSHISDTSSTKVHTGSFKSLVNDTSSAKGNTGSFKSVVSDTNSTKVHTGSFKSHIKNEGNEEQLIDFFS